MVPHSKGGWQIVTSDGKEAIDLLPEAKEKYMKKATAYQNSNEKDIFQLCRSPIAFHVPIEFLHGNILRKTNATQHEQMGKKWRIFDIKMGPVTTSPESQPLQTHVQINIDNQGW